MELMRLGEPGQEIPAARQDGITYDLRGVTADITGAFLGADGISRVREALTAGELPALAGTESLRVGPPVTGIGAVVCVGQNYAAHAAETGDQPPKAPIIFFKHPNTVVGPNDDVVIPPGAQKVDWEVELAVVIGKRASYLSSTEEALECIAGFTISNDVSERDYQIVHSGGQWSKGKCAPTFNPLGPALIPADDVADPQALRLYSKVNGEDRQDSTTADMVFSIGEIIRDLSQYMALDPGDVVNTGTPQGVALSGRFPYLAQGDVMTIGVEGLGEQQQRVVAF
ncbi:2-keto-4-pentenoate hydratase/2-oxohepta-3-ene-1,7-dioic acid hydratase [Pseudarthrobacter phenanthrenivorans Sphe3]|uniref:2-keto-4-pentenoate hydratase/2-oxohepta-3-ene-1,7-dioic acid hydratase n=1 Tax=Pseudarthrobacter phenanthrenivorans (strain DSM 18606 / JCM 16027 / LMG 23796 / Sphe3) TaxID=930171 RepID=F0M677_PSEPM|nr:fumarylacetoacetate hydrolase family protein [Pseudarthrobacter phenanthrenivorans]ADX71348.1 2-keto-4-pentenoate hydratase/2-oxohepta-3-ene-1,7-dioic acid hydratase [Pseudarthrobacter phenanthrenivorans Sphe3]